MDITADMVWQMWVVLALIAGVITVYCLDRFSIELVSATTVAMFLVFFHAFPLPNFGPTEILAGFANPALITIMALLIIGQGMFQTGALEGPARRLARLSEKHPRFVLTLLFASMFVVSAFLNNTPVVVMFIPIVAALAGRLGRSPSKVMIPLSFVCILAGMTTLIGSSTNLLVSDALRQATGEGLEFFAQTRIGLMLAGVGLVYMLLFAGRLLPDRKSPDEEIAGESGRQFIAQIEITPDHPLVGHASRAGLFEELRDMTVRLIQRGEHAYLPPFDGLTLRPGDLIIVAATRKTITDVISSRTGFFAGAIEAAAGDEVLTSGDDEETPDLSIVEAVVAPASRLIGRSIEQAAFRTQTGCVVIGVQRRSRMIRTRMTEIRLESGDVLLVLGSRRALRALREQRDVLPLEWSATDVPDLGRAATARLVFAGVVILASTGIIPILHASVIGALTMLIAKCINFRQAARAFDQRIYLLIGAAFALGGALQATGGADFLAGGVVGLAEPFGPLALLSTMFLLVAVLTNILSNSATAILFAPIAVSAAERTGIDPTIFVLTVLFAANCSFATPIAYQTNLLVMGPGRYRFTDFIRVGGPLVVVIWITYTAIAAWSFDL